jgi:hypothetical protein
LIGPLTGRCTAMICASTDRKLRKAELYLGYLDSFLELAHAKNVEFRTLDRVLCEFDDRRTANFNAIL